MRLPLVLNRALAGLALLFLALSPGIANAKTPTGPPQACRGTDMLEELKAADPGTYQKILADAAKVENGNAVLWKVEKPGIAPSHLMGTMHVSDERITRLSPAMKAAIAGSKVVMLEIGETSDKATIAAIGRSAGLMLFRDGRRLDKMLGADEFQKVKATLSRAGLPGEAAALVRPWIVSTLLAVSECERKNAEAGHAVLDSRIAQEAKARKVKVAALETVDSQLAAMAAIPDEEQVEMLRAALKFADRSADMLETLAQMYLKRQMGAAMPFNLALAAKAGVEPTAFSGFQQQLLDKRNLGMFDKSRREVDKGSAFIAVGALHLSGPTGLVKLYRDAGYTVTAVE